MTDIVRATKAQIIELMADEALGFFTWMDAGTGPGAVETREMWHSVKGMNLCSPTIQAQIIPNLMGQGVITQATVDRIDAYIAKETGPQVFGSGN